MQLIDMPETYLTISAPQQGLYKEKGSKFLAFAFPVESIDEVSTLLAEHRKEYYDARHVCYAYMLGADRLLFRANDDGEPSGTAGRPILGQINSFNLTNILIIVVRYFGGILLGTGGLIQAYKQAAADAITNADIVERDVMVPKTLRFPYEKTTAVMRTIKDTQSKILSQDFDNATGECIINLSVKKHYESRF